MNFEKSVKDAKWFAVGLLVLAVAVLGFKIFTNTLDTLSIVFGIGQVGVIIATIIGLDKKQKYGPICGIIAAPLLILSRDIISLVFGILYLIDCITILSHMSKNQ